MTRRARRLRLILVLITSGLAVLAVASSILAIRYQDRIAEASRYNRTFDLGQATIELLRLQLSFSAFQSSDPAASRNDVDLRYQILLNRIRTLREADWGVGEQDPQESSATMARLEAVGTALAPMAAEPGRPGAAARAAALLRPLNADLARLSSLAHAHAGDLVGRNQSDLRVMLAGLCLMIIALVGFGLVLLALLRRQTVTAGRIAREDSLTGIGNRLLLTQKLAAVRPHEEQAIILLDVDHFKDINDTLGHIQGDQFLVALSRRLREAVADAGLFARLGGDEFALLFTGPFSRARAEACAARILQALREPLSIDHGPIRAGVSMGIAARRPSDRHDAVETMKNADIALYAAKASGRGRFLTFDETMSARTHRRQQLVQGLSTAIERGELFLAFQPIVDLGDGSIDGFEALLRWRHPVLGPISPAEFVPIAEESGLIVEIGRWVVQEACREAGRWPGGARVSINVSARQFADPLLVRCIEAATARHGLAAGRLTVEVTESVLIANDDEVLSVLRTLRALGVAIALDDFGTGYASLGYLRRFPFDKIKIDQSFVRGSESDASSLAIVTAICGLATSLGLDIVAEGIETAEHRDLVRAAGCRLGQGYLFDRPLQAEEALGRIVADASRAAMRGPATRAARPDDKAPALRVA